VITAAILACRVGDPAGRPGSASYRLAVVTSGDPGDRGGGGETDLRVLLASMEPELVPGEWVYTTASTGLALPAGADPVVLVREREGVTLVLARSDADRLGLVYGYVAAMVSLRVHSALAAVGLTAAVASCLADAGLSCNVVAGFHHDHLFVPYERGAECVELLRRLSGGSVG
jgi:hypothetical protein